MSSHQPALFVFHAITDCDGCGREVEVWTDGRMAYADHARSYDRMGTVVTVHCAAADPLTEEVCTGIASFDLVESGPWTVADDYAQHAMSEWGEEVN